MKKELVLQRAMKLKDAVTSSRALAITLRLGMIVGMLALLCCYLYLMVFANNNSGADALVAIMHA